MKKIPLTFGPHDVTVERRPDGSMIVRSPHPLQAYPKAMTNWLDHWARAAPDRVFLAERVEGAWRKVTYAEARGIARRIAQGIIDRGLSTERPIAILSGNSVDHALIGLGAMIAGVPGGFKWSSQPLDGSCDEDSKTALGSFWAGALVLTRSTAGGRARGAAAILGSDCGRHAE